MREFLTGGAGGLLISHGYDFWVAHEYARALLSWGVCVELVAAEFV